ncbi:MAG: hypothetical protein HY934_10585 [Candidatus Firestonebacteria bacterium]|nr:hypothetical protein [Candidatus Firestonebacteria bacterium]
MHKSEMEKVIYIKKIAQLSNIEDNINRVYFGEEFCQWILPSLEDFKNARKISEEKGINFTCVLPYFSESCINKLSEILKILSNYTSCEVVINDWGSLYFINKHFPEFKIILGRLLTKQRRGVPVISYDDIPLEGKKMLRTNCINSPYWINFLNHFHIERAEIDNTHDLREHNIDLPLKWSIYYPYGYITTTRLCFYNYGKNGWQREKRGGTTCSRSCLGKNIRLHYPSFDSEIYLLGNTQIYKSKSLPSNLSKYGIDRIIDNNKLLINVKCLNPNVKSMSKCQIIKA